MQYVSHSSYLVSIGAIPSLIYIYETTVKQFLPQIVLKAVSEHKKTPKPFWRGMPPDPPRSVGNN